MEHQTDVLSIKQLSEMTRDISDNGDQRGAMINTVHGLGWALNSVKMAISDSTGTIREIGTWTWHCILCDYGPSAWSYGIVLMLENTKYKGKKPLNESHLE